MKSQPVYHLSPLSYQKFDYAGVAASHRGMGLPFLIGHQEESNLDILRLLVCDAVSLRRQRVPYLFMVQFVYLVHSVLHYLCSFFDCSNSRESGKLTDQ